MQEKTNWRVRASRSINQDIKLEQTAANYSIIQELTSAEALQVANQLASLGTFEQIEVWVEDKLFQIIYPKGLAYTAVDGKKPE